MRNRIQINMVLVMFTLGLTHAVAVLADPVPGDVVLKSSERAGELERTADQLAGSGGFNEAVALYQQIIEEFPNELQERPEHPGGVFYAKSRSIEAKIQSLGEPGIQAYQYLYDGAARAILGDMNQARDLKKLSKVAWRYYLSSYGDDAAFVLGCLLLDQSDFTGAVGYLRRALAHPDLSIDRIEVRRRLLAAYAGSGDRVRYEALKASLDLSVEQRFVYDQMLDVALTERQVGVVENWVSSMGNMRRDGKMAIPQVDLAQMPGPLEQLWKYPEHHVLKLPTPQSYRLAVHRGKREPKAITLEETYLRWVNLGWVPSGEPAFVGGQMLLRSADRAQALNLETGRMVWQGKKDMFQTGYDGDHWQRAKMPNYHLTAHPVSYEERMFFADSIGRQVMVHDGWMFYIAGQIRLTLHAMTEKRITRGETVLGNSLVVLNLDTQGQLAGKLGMRDAIRVIRLNGRWAQEENVFKNVQFLSLPVVSNGIVVVPVLHGRSEVYLYGLDLKTLVRSGELDEMLLWKQFLYKYQDDLSPKGGEVSLMVQGSCVFVSTGQGLLSSHDIFNGELRWLTLYPRHAPNRGAGYHKLFYPNHDKTWHKHRMTMLGDQLLVTPIDSDALMSIDPETGVIRWTANRSKILQNSSLEDQTIHGTVLLGTVQDRVLVSGAAGLKAYDTVTNKKTGSQAGEVAWEVGIKGGRVTGVSALTPTRAWVPVMSSAGEKQVMVIDLIKGELIQTIPVKYNGKDPLGNLFIHGESIYSIGADRVRAFKLEPQVAPGTDVDNDEGS